jgi:hypothetical protein
VRHGTRIIAIAASTALGLMALAGTAVAKHDPTDPNDPNGVHTTANVDQLEGGGVSKWGVDNDSTTCIDDGANSGLAIEDASLQAPTWDDDADPPPPPWDDAFDGALMPFIDGNVFPPATPATTNTTSTYAAGPATVGGVDVTVRYDTFASDPILRQLVTLTNSTDAPLTFTFGWGNDSGSDDSTTIIGTSTGGATVTLGDSWVTSNQDGDDDNDPVDTYVPFGNGNVLHPNAFGGTCGPYGGGGGSGDELGLLFPVTLDPGATRYLMFFAAIDTDDATALTRGPSLTSTCVTSPFVADLSADVKANILNWAFPVCPIALTPDFTG